MNVPRRSDFNAGAFRLEKERLGLIRFMLRATVITGALVCAVLSYFAPVRADSSPDACQDAYAVLEAGRNNSDKAAFWNWDQRKLLSAAGEYTLCLRAAKTRESRGDAITGSVFAYMLLGFYYQNMAGASSVATTVPLAKRKSGFDYYKSRGLSYYNSAKEIILTALRYPQEIDDDSLVELKDYYAHYKQAQPDLATLTYDRAAKTFNARLHQALLKSSANKMAVSTLSSPKPAPTRCPADREPAVVHAVSPVTPKAAFDSGISGEVQVQISIDENGAVGSAAVKRSASPLLNDAALAAAQASTFRPAIVNCKPVSGSFIFIVDFTTQ